MRLYINIDHVATVRQARRTDEPDPVRAAVLVELAGADGITVHLREDRRHIQDRDVRLLMETVRTGLNLELAAGKVTTEGGLALVSSGTRDAIGAALAHFEDAPVRTALFIDPDEEAVRISADLGVDAVELHTGEYANARGAERDTELVRIAGAAALARSLGLAVHAGHGLTYENVVPVAAIGDIEELNIGHSIVSRAIFVGLDAAVREMAALVGSAPRR
jgi:pyridoxine 5-phosphate synthase